MTIEQLNKCTGFSSNQFLQPINDTLEKYNINTPLRIAHFLAQILTESGNLTTFIENLSYSTNALLKTFPTHFNTTTAPLFAFKPQQIANIVYANRYGNGDSASGDGWNYRGRGHNTHNLLGFMCFRVGSYWHGLYLRYHSGAQRLAGEKRKMGRAGPSMGRTGSSVGATKKRARGLVGRTRPSNGTTRHSACKPEHTTNDTTLGIQYEL